jgi:nucleotide-binding universal stress UspA family protein
MAITHGGMVTLLHVINYGQSSRGHLRPYMKTEHMDTLEQQGLDLLAKVKSDLESIQVVDKDETVAIETMLAWGNPADVIVEKAREKEYNLIVMGSRGLGAISGLLLGSVSDRVVKLAPCPVLIIRND